VFNISAGFLNTYCLLFFFNQKIDASTIEDFYGLTSDIQKSSETGYILFYQSRDCVWGRNCKKSTFESTVWKDCVFHELLFQMSPLWSQLFHFRFVTLGRKI